MMLRPAPHLVKDFSRAEPVGFSFGFEPAYRGWTTQDRTVTGHIGYPQAATAEKGEYLFAAYAAGVTRLLEDVIAWDGKSWETS
jgi:creatinine amidohydrolase